MRLSRVNSSIVKKRVPKTSQSGTRGGSRRLPAQTALDDHVRARVKAFLADSLLSEEQFGQTVLGDPKFVPGLDKGRSMRLDAADRVLRFMGEFAIGPRFRREIEAFTTVTGTKRSTLGEKATGERAFVSRLKRGKPPRLKAVQHVRTWMHEHASEEERAAIARAVADDGMAGPALSLDPAASVASDKAPDPGDSPHESLSRRERKPFLSTREAAALLNLSPRTLDRMRTSGNGPAYHKFANKVAYARADLLAWAWARRHEENLEAD